jgi:hypothetical protein
MLHLSRVRDGRKRSWGTTRQSSVRFGKRLKVDDRVIEKMYLLAVDHDTFLAGDPW